MNAFNGPEGGRSIHFVLVVGVYLLIISVLPPQSTETDLAVMLGEVYASQKHKLLLVVDRL